MQTTTNLSLKKPEYTDFADIADINSNMDTLDAKVADVRDSKVSFSDSDLDSFSDFPGFLAKIVSNMKLATFLRDCVKGFGYVLHKGSLKNNGTTTTAGTYALDAAYGKTLNDSITTLNDSLTSAAITSLSNAELATGLYAFSATTSGVPTNLPGVLIQQQTSGYVRQMAVCGGASDNVKVYYRSYYRSGGGGWPNWTQACMVQSKTVTGTTNTNGNLALNLSATDYIVLSVRINSNNAGIATPWNSNSAWWVRITDSQGAAKASSSVEAYVEYKDINS